MALILICAVGGFYGLGASSLWMDELLTAYFTDPSIATFSDFIQRAAQDTHPPGYYLLLWFVASVLGGDFTHVARGFSAVFALLAVVVLYFALPRGTSRFGRLFACAFAATSTSWFYYSQEARSYTLVFFLSLILLLIAFRLRSALSNDRRVVGLLCAFGFVGAVSGLVHYYTVPLTGGILVLLIVLAKHWRQRLTLALTGLAVLLPVAGYILWHVSQIVVDVNDMWIEATPRFVISQTYFGMTRLFGSPVGALPTLILLFCAMYSLFARRQPEEPGSRGQWSVDYALVIGSGIVALGFAVLVTMVIPSYSYRFIIVLSPVLWIFTGLLADTMVKTVPARFIVPIGGVLVTLLALQAGKIAWRDVPMKQAWRESAERVARMPECGDAPLPVVWDRRTRFRDFGPAETYGYYLPDAASREWLRVLHHRLPETLKEPPLAEIIATRIERTTACPLLLWALHHVSFQQMEDIKRMIEADSSVPAGTRIRLCTFSTPDMGWLGRLLRFEGGPAAAQILVDRGGSRSRPACPT